jgi:amidase
VTRLLTEVDALLVPVAAVSAVAHGEGVEVDGHLVGGPALMAQCRAISLTGLPSLAVPVMSTDGGRTVSVQVVGAAGDDALCCEIAAELGAGIAVGVA